MENNYTKYDSLDFSQDDFFIKWVKTKDAEASRFWENWLKENPEKTEEVKTARHLVLAIHVEEKEPSQQQIQQLWNEIDQTTKVDDNARTPIRRISTIRWISYAAAACIGLLLVFYIARPKMTVITSGHGELVAYFMPDSSLVELNAASVLKFKKKNWTQNRTIALEGEAFFDVRKGTAFTVSTPQGKVEVLGTSFNVFARDDDFEVACFTGKVKVSDKAETSQVLSRGKSTKISKEAQLQSPYNFNLNKEAGWRKGLFVFEAAPLKKAFDELERQFNLNIEADEAVLNKTVDIFFEKGNIDTALYKICYPLGLEWEREGDVVLIR
ncbi:MAG: hypothetical protein GY705_23720 [Bacteroidetes bacterium]|nr:hypothetical protein [Bacteroidota bacterium]